MNALAPLAIALPLAAAALLLAIGPKLRNRVPDSVALIVALACAALAAVLARAALGGPLIEWMGGWRPREGVAIGIAIVVDPAGGGLAAMVCLLFAASFVFAWGYFAEVGVRFHVLMLLFLAGMVGLCLAGDLFNMFVFFELMSVAAFSLTAYRLEASDLEGAMNFTVTNTLGSFFILGGIGLIYGRTGALNFAQLGHAVASLGGDPLVAASFVMLAVGFLIKGAIVPFHFWLADAHAVAPSPVSVIFSGAMVALGVFAVARLFWTVFAFDPALAAPARVILVDFGAATTLVGAVACLGQRHLKRLLAFSTIAHTGIQLIGIGLMKQEALAGAFLYILGHGLVKGALFMLAGVLLALCSGIDEIALRGAGRRLPLAAAAFGLAGLLLAGAPIGAADAGLAAIDRAARETGQGWLAVVLLAGSALTGAAVLRAGGRIFLGWGPTPGEEEEAPSEEEREKPDRPVWLMLLPILVLLVLAIAAPFLVRAQALRAAAAFAGPAGYAAAVLGGGGGGTAGPALATMPAGGAGSWLAWCSVALALLIAGGELARDRLPRILLRINHAATEPVLAVVRLLHNGVIGDYVAWIVIGLAGFAAVFVFGP